MKRWNWITQVLIAVLICGLMPFSVQGEEISCEERAALKKRIDRQLSDAMIFKSGVNHAFVGVRRQIDPLDTDVMPFMEENTLLVPARFTGEVMGAQVEWYEKTQSIYIKTAFSVLQVNIGEKKYEVNGKSYPMDTAAALKSDHVYLPVTAVAQAFSKKLSMFGDMAVLDSREVSFTQEEPYDACVEAVADKLYYDRPTGEKVIADLKAKNPQNAHPRILADRDKIESIKALAKEGGRFGGWVEKLISSAAGDLEKEPVKYVKPDGYRLLETSRSVLSLSLIHI